MTIVGKISIFVVLLGQFGYLAASHYFGIERPSIIFWLLAYSAAIYTAFGRDQRFDFCRADAYFLCYLLVLAISFAVFGFSNNTEFAYRLFAFIAIPYWLGRRLGAKIYHSYWQLILLILGSYIVILFYLFASSPELFTGDRFIAFPSDIAQFENAGGDPSQAYIGTAFGFGLIVTCCRYLSLPRSGQFTMKVLRYFLMTIALMLVAVIVSIGARGGLLACVLALMLVLYYRKIDLIRFAVGVGAVLIFTYSIVLLFISDDRAIFYGEIFDASLISDSLSGCNMDTSVGARIALVSEAVRLFWDSPFFGIGAGNYGLYYCAFKTEFGSPHSFLFQQLAELGLIGLIIWCLFIFEVWVNGRATVTIQDSDVFQVSSYAFGIWAFFLIWGEFSGNVYYDYHFFLWTGILVSIYRRKQKDGADCLLLPRIQLAKN